VSSFFRPIFQSLLAGLGFEVVSEARSFGRESGMVIWKGCGDVVSGGQSQGDSLKGEMIWLSFYLTENRRF
jgi:hypothetical protein